MPVTVRNKSCVPAGVRAIWGPPALLPIEDPTKWDRLAEEIAKAVKPVDFIDWLLVKEVADFTRHLYLLRRIQAALLCPTKLANTTFKQLSASAPEEFANAEVQVMVVMKFRDWQF